MSRTVRAAHVLPVLVLVLGCAPAPKASSPAGSSEEIFVHDDATLEAPAGLIPVPLVRQKTPFSCGNAAELAVLRYYEPQRFGAVSESSLYAPLHTTPKDGTDPGPMADYLRHEPGLAAEARWSTPDSNVELGDLERAVDRGEPSIVAVQAWQAVATLKELKPWATDWDDGHYLVVIGYDRTRLYFMDPSTGDRYTYIPIGEFAERWHDVLGAAAAHVQHIAVFVHSSASSESAARLGPLPVVAVH
jgi:predicted double-glycine peptidase